MGVFDQPGLAPALVAASYNIHRCFGTDRKYWPERIVEVLRGLDADVIALQEVDMRLLADHRHQLDFLAAELGMHHAAGANIQDHRGVFGNALLSRFPIRKVRLLDLSVRRFEPRGAIFAHLDLGGGGDDPGKPLDLLVVATHLGLNAAERRLQVRRLLHALAGEPAEVPVVLMGDCNEWKPNHGALRSLNRRFGLSMMPRTFPSRFPLLPLDRIWVSPRSALSRAAVYATPLTRVASDHLPLRAEIRWDAADLPKAWRETPILTQG
jgi:endonuclease/exonuclease/phosphatase family metal-dependent hydrolase